MTATVVLVDPAESRAAEERAARLERVRRALRKAETATGVQPVDWASITPPASHLTLVPNPALNEPAADAPAFTATEGEVDAPQVRARRTDGTKSAGGEDAAAADPEISGAQVSPRWGAGFGGDGAWLPVPTALAPLLPYGAVRRGSIVEATGSTAVLLHLVASLAGQEAWSAVVARPDLGLAAALAAGIDPSRLVLVPDPGPTPGSVMGALVDGFDVVVLGHCPALSTRERRSIAQRIRHRGAVLLSSAPWPEATLRLAATERSSGGIVEKGRLTSVGVVVDVSGRGGDRRRCGLVELTTAGLVPAPGVDHTVPDPAIHSDSGDIQDVTTEREAG